MAQTINSFSDFQNYMTQTLKDVGAYTDTQGAPHGMIWESPPTNTRDGFVGGNVFGVQLIAVKDPDNSGFIQALEGRGPFDPNTGTFPRMPADGKYFSTEQIKPIRDWITAGCPA